MLVVSIMFHVAISSARVGIPVSIYVSGKPILTVDKNYICSKNGMCTNEQLQILKPLEEITTGKPPDQNFFFEFHLVWSGQLNRATHQIFIDWFISQSKDGCGISYKKKAEKEKTAERERERRK